MRLPRLLVVLLLTGSLHAQLVERIEVRVTNVDVVVTDRAGERVTGLTRDDFELFENGKVRELTNFYEVRADAPALSAEAATNPATDVSVTPPPKTRRRIVLFLDEYSLHPKARREVVASIDRALESLVRFGDEVMLVTWNRRLEIITPFTKDRELVRNALRGLRRQTGGMAFEAARNAARERIMAMANDARNDTRRGRGAYDEARSLARAYADEVATLESSLIEAAGSVVRLLSSGEGKKVLVFAGAQLPEQPARDLFALIDSVFATIARRMGDTAPTDGTLHNMRPKLDELARTANAGGVTIYMLDTADSSAGVVPTAEGAIAEDSTSRFVEFTETSQAFSSLARKTGGVALLATSNYDVALRAVERDLASYYALGYRSDIADGLQRKIEVRVKNPLYRVRSRDSFTGKPVKQEIEERVTANIFRTAVESTVAISVTTGAPIKHARGVWRVPITITMPSTLTLLPEGPNVAGGFTVYFASGTERGALSPVSQDNRAVRMPAGEVAKLRAKPMTYQAAILLREGEHVLSVAVVDQITGESGYARVKVKAP